MQRMNLLGRKAPPHVAHALHLVATQPRAVHAAFLALLVAASLWLLLVQEEAAVLRFRPQSLQKHLFQATHRPQHAETPISPQVAALLTMGDRALREERGEIYPEDLHAEDWTQHVPRRDALHLAAIQRACVAHVDSAISVDFGARWDSDPARDGLLNRTTATEADREALLERLRQCPAADLFVPAAMRRERLCEDAAAYTKYLHARILPRWVLEVRLFDRTLGREVTYHELCPYTPMVFLNAHWDGVRHDPAWPSTKPLFFAPDIESTALGVQHLRQADVMLCKTAVCALYVTLWLERQGNPRMARVVYHRFTSNDVTTSALASAGLESWDARWSERVKDFERVHFVHVAGASMAKGSGAVLDCWLSRPDLPRLDVYMSKEQYRQHYHKPYGARLEASRNVHVHAKTLDAAAAGKLLAQSAFVLSTSDADGGYAHGVNHARAAGAVVVTADAPPVNELVTPSSGVLHGVTRISIKDQLLGGESAHPMALRGVPGLAVVADGAAICDAVDELVAHTDAAERRGFAQRARQQFLYDTAFFAWKMRALRAMLEPAAAS